ncbi:DUF6371 domain-containing protein [Methylobacterium sp. J-048]|uniref:DUF6371 domain-containing protein n=1 Tax=Methylobacterium sp. J-048 TaxID=2836635 RepID=UPI001FBAC90A|nr:DUF6371 domain-containing protein [Methylobacterium sp. J-048]MCJ2059801.1 DUF6371 domain-containing protein [Methylobacterium sp. J-048]
MSDPFAPIAGGPAPRPEKPPAFVPVLPVPSDAPQPPKTHPSLGAPSATWSYRDAAGNPLGFACRFNKPDGGKDFRPLVLFRSAAGGPAKWRWEAWPAPRPLYGLDRLAARPEAPVVVTEGEKSADAAALLLPDYVAITSPNGSKSAPKADWTPLRGRTVVIWPDADAPGIAYADAVHGLATAAGAASVVRIAPPIEAEGNPGWDAADALAAGWRTDRVRFLVAGARSAEPTAAPGGGAAEPIQLADHRASKGSGKRKAKDEGEGGGRGPGRPPWHETLMGYAGDFDLWHAPDRTAYATVRMKDGHRENWRIDSEAFGQMLTLRAYKETGRIPSKSGLEETTRLLISFAREDGPCRRPWLRVGERDGRLYLDLGRPKWEVVEVSARGVEILEDHDLPFIRPEGMQPLPEPELGSERGIEEMRRFVNVETETDFQLIVMWMLSAIREAREYPLLILNGEQGTGKSTLSRLLRSIIDPHEIDISSAPDEDRDLFVLAQHAHVLALDNLSKIENWMSDTLCIFATGGSLAKRSMHTNADLTILRAKRPVILNGIPTLANRPDLAQRAITVRLQPVSAEVRATSTKIEAEWQDAAPRVLGTLLEAMSRGLQLESEIVLDKLPRLAGFAQWSAAVAPGLGWDGGEVYDAFMANQRQQSDSTFENDPIAQAIHRMMQGLTPPEWKGTATHLLEAISHPDVTPEAKTRSPMWPRTPQILGNAMDRIGQVLRDHGYDVTKQHSGSTFYTIRVV